MDMKRWMSTDDAILQFFDLENKGEMDLPLADGNV